ncbi:MAG: hypothetical protein LBL19_01970 [Spirochaetaceae bacterium]|jgi:hypothetical protein|nr:hypothetical protein [Spirochaetaceae bacterium]
MSVKKSLWIGLALAAIGLLFLGCSTGDSEPSGGTFSYQKTALWEAISEAQTALYAAKVSVNGDGKDIATTETWVSPVQYNAFNKDIAEARAAAESLGRNARAAIEPTPAELPYITKLAAAQTQFNAGKQPGIAVAASSNTFVGSSGAGTNFDLDEPVVVKEDVTITSKVTITADNTVTIEDATLTLVKDDTNTGTAVVIKGEIAVKEGGTLVLDGGKRNGTETEAAGSLAAGGQIVLYSGAKSIDQQWGGASLGQNAGSTLVHAGAILIIYNEEGQRIVNIGPDKGEDKGQVIQLTAGTLTTGVKVYSNDKNGMFLNGTATLVSEVTAGEGNTPNVILSSTSTLVIANKGNLIRNKNDNFLEHSEDGAKIVLETGGSLTIYNQGSGDAITDNASVAVKLTNLTWTISDDPVLAKITGPATLIKSGTNWVKQ